MRRIISILVLSLFFIHSYAQDVSFSNLDGLDINIYAEQFDGQEYMIISFGPTDKYIAVENTSLNIEFFTGDVLKIKGYVVNIGSQTNTRTNANTTIQVQKDIMYYRFDLSAQDVEKFKSGIKNLSIYTIPRVYRKSYDKDKIGQKLYNVFMEQKDKI